MVFRKARIKTKSSQTSITIRDNKISRALSTNLLWTIIDDQLKYNIIKNKVSKLMGILCKMQKYFDQQTLHNLYYTFEYSYLICGVELWGNACYVYLDSLVKL